MNLQEIEFTVISVLEVILKCEIDSESSRQNTPLWDSLKHIEVVFALEDELEIQFPENTLPQLENVQYIVGIADRLLNAA